MVTSVSFLTRSRFLKREVSSRRTKVPGRGADTTSIGDKNGLGAPRLKRTKHEGGPEWLPGYKRELPVDLCTTLVAF